MAEINNKDLVRAVNELGSINKAAKALGIARETAQRRYKHANSLEYSEVPSEEVPVDELIRRKLDDQERIKQHKDAAYEIRVKVKMDGPIGIAMFGDPHCDDDYCDLKQLLADADVVRDTNGLMGANLGDNQNLWPGRLARLYAHQRTRADEGWRLTEHFIQRVEKWLFMVKGNHDHFVGNADPLDWINRAHDAPVGDYDIRLVLEFPNGFQYRIWVRHDFPGHSQYHNIHGMVKVAYRGAPYHLFAGGHKHCSAVHAEYNEFTRLFWHGVRATGYKLFDDHADSLMLGADHELQCPTVIIDPEATKARDVARVEYSPQAGADYLTHLRNKRGL